MMSQSSFFSDTVTSVFLSTRDKGMFLRTPTNQFIFKLPAPLYLDPKCNYHFCLRSLSLPNTIVNLSALDGHGFSVDGEDHFLPDCSVNSLSDLNRACLLEMSAGRASFAPPFRFSLDPYFGVASLLVSSGHSVVFTPALAAMIGFRDGVSGPFPAGEYLGERQPDFLGSALRIINVDSPCIQPRLCSNLNYSLLYSFVYEPRPDTFYSQPIRVGSLAYVPVFSTTLNEFEFSFTASRTGQKLSFVDLEDFPILFQLDLVRRSYPL